MLDILFLLGDVDVDRCRRIDAMESGENFLQRLFGCMARAMRRDTDTDLGVARRCLSGRGDDTEQFVRLGDEPSLTGIWFLATVTAVGIEHR